MEEVRAITVHSQSNIDIPGFVVTPTGLVVNGEPTFEEWEQCGWALELAEESIQWARGDHLNYGEGRWGEMYAQHLDDTGKSYTTLAHYKWVSKEIEFCRRRQNLSWSHHEEIAPLKLTEQDMWLDRAEQGDDGKRWSQKRLRDEIREHKRHQEAIKGLESLPANLDERYQLICGDAMVEMAAMQPGSVDAIITDPPYPQEYVNLYGELARLARTVLKPGGSLLAMAGQSYLPDLMALMVPHLTYNWTLAYLTPGGQSPQLWQRKVNTFWKPVLWFVRGEYEGRWQGDVIGSDENDKRFHDWGQSEGGMFRLVERFTLPGDLVLDPFCGGGTTGAVALALDRRFIGIDKDEDAIKHTLGRLAGAWKYERNEPVGAISA